MYNPDGTLRIKTNKKPGPQSSLNLGWAGNSSKENCSAVSNSPTSSPKAAGVKTKVTSIGGSDSPQTSRPHRPGNDVRQKANQGSIVFGDSDAASELGQRGVSEAKKRALYGSRVFANGSEPAAAPTSELSQLKLREVTGHDIFNRDAAPEEPKRAILGGVRKAPGGGSSLSMKDLHPGSPTAQTRSANGANGVDRHHGSNGNSNSNGIF